jgi:hypothetical protein
MPMFYPIDAAEEEEEDEAVECRRNAAFNFPVS